MNRKILIVLLAVILSPLLRAQDNTDFGLWYTFKTDKNLYKGLRADFEACLRTDQGGSHTDSWYLEPGLRYKFNKYFAAGIYYRFIQKAENDGQMHARHRIAGQLKGDLPIQRFTLSVRYRVQEQTKTYIKDPEDEVPVWFSRTGFEIDYDVPDLPIKPYASVELFSQMGVNNDIAFEDVRYTAGAEYKLFKRHTVGLEYIRHLSKISNPETRNIISVVYSFGL